MRLLTISMAMMLGSVASAGMRRAPVPHAITSPGGHFVFTMVPGPEGEERTKGFGICSEVRKDGSLTELWRTSGWYSEDLELHFDGDVLIRIGSWASGDQEKEHPENSLAVAFYQEGKEVKRYFVSDLVKDLSKLEHTSAGVKWLEPKVHESPAFRPGEDAFQLQTVDGIRYRFDMAGGIIGAEGVRAGGEDLDAESE